MGRIYSLYILGFILVCSGACKENCAAKTVNGRDKAQCRKEIIVKDYGSPAREQAKIRTGYKVNRKK